MAAVARESIISSKNIPHYFYRNDDRVCFPRRKRVAPEIIKYPPALEQNIMHMPTHIKGLI
jgi:hypothetical protein